MNTLKVKDLKKAIENLPDDLDVIIEPINVTDKNSPYFYDCFLVKEFKFIDKSNISPPSLSIFPGESFEL